MVERKLKFSVKVLNELSFLAKLHDIGKIAIKENILQKAKPLTSEERREIKKHSEIDYRIVLNMPGISSIAEYILHHHELWDGKGYPKGLAGKDIPFESRIIAIVDSYEAMTVERPYKKTLSENSAVEEIIRNAGAQFEPCLLYTSPSPRD